MQINIRWLQDKNACVSVKDWFESKFKEVDSNELLDTLIAKKQIKWANWLIVRLLNKENCVQYAIYAAESVLHIFEKKFPNDNRPRNAILAAKAYLNNPNKNAEAAEAAAAEAAEAAAAEAATED
jgi:hypothetical protein